MASAGAFSLDTKNDAGAITVLGTNAGSGGVNATFSSGSSGGALGVPKKGIDVKECDMTEEMRAEALAVASAALEKMISQKLTQYENVVAMEIKTHFDKKFGGHWHCIVGREFRSLVTHETKKFIFFYADDIAVLLYKC